jgi:hypothetical protein
MVVEKQLLNMIRVSISYLLKVAVPANRVCCSQEAQQIQAKNNTGKRKCMLEKNERN